MHGSGAGAQVEEKKAAPPTVRDIIVVGASVGGVQALRTLVGGLRRDLPAAVFIVLHMSPEHRTKLHEMLDALGTIPVELATNMRPIVRGHAYLAPADHHLLLGDEHIRVIRGPHENGHRPAVDPLFRTA